MFSHSTVLATYIHISPSLIFVGQFLELSRVKPFWYSTPMVSSKALPTKIRLGCLRMEVVSTLAY
jgi:hypothetical protein